ncbi:MAG: DUF1579 domain-containing protein [Bacteroidetes bacterium]|nr:MAG: DUF1579 domain-containing protein [Bacteroidota bacterium]
MKRAFLTICTAAILFACNDEKKSEENKPAETTAATESKTETAPQIDPAAMNKAMEDFAKPGKMHEWLASFNGAWDATVIGYMDPSKPDTSKVSQTYSMTLNGLYQEGKLAGNMMGMPFEGKSLTGFDNSKKYLYQHGLIILVRGLL